LRAITKQPRGDGGARGVVARPRLQRALEGLLGQILGVRAVAHAVGEEAADAPDVLVIDG